MMMRRRAVVRGGRPGLLGTAARTAVIAGTFRMTNNAMNNRAARQDDQQVPQQQAAPEQAPQYAAPPQDDLSSQLERLGSLRDSGVLSPEEFDAAKSKLLSG